MPAIPLRVAGLFGATGVGLQNPQICLFLEKRQFRGGSIPQVPQAFKSADKVILFHKFFAKSEGLRLIHWRWISALTILVEGFRFLDNLLHSAAVVKRWRFLVVKFRRMNSAT